MAVDEPIGRRRCQRCLVRWPQRADGLCQRCYTETGGKETKRQIARESAKESPDVVEALKKMAIEQSMRFRTEIRNGEEVTVVWCGACGSLDYVRNSMLGVGSC